MSRLATVMALELLVCGCGPPAPPAGPDGAASVPEGLPGTWTSEAHGVSLTLSPEGTFEWKQGEIQKKGTYWVEGQVLVLVVDKRYPTKYAMVELGAGRLVISDPAGTQVAFQGGPVSGEPSEQDPGAVVGAWTNVEFAVRIELAEDSTFMWKQGELVETGTYSVEAGSIHMTTGGYTSTYRLVSVSKSEMVVQDPSGNELPLVRAAAGPKVAHPEPMGKDSLLAGAPPIKIVDLGEGGGGPSLAGSGTKAGSPSADSVVGPGGLFFFVPPSGWKVDTQKVCGNKFTSAGMRYACWRRNDLFTPDAARVHFEIATFMTWAAPGALDTLSPEIDAMLAAYDQDRTSVSDDISEMAGYEVFSTRIDGRASGSSKQLRGRIIGIHFGDLLVVGLLAISADPDTLVKWGGQVDAALDSMAFHFPENAALSSAIQGTWKGGGTKWTFWSDGTYVKGEEAGSWAVHGHTLVMAADPQGGGRVVARPAYVEDDVLSFGDDVLEKQ